MKFSWTGSQEELKDVYIENDQAWLTFTCDSLDYMVTRAATKPENMLAKRIAELEADLSKFITQDNAKLIRIRELEARLEADKEYRDHYIDSHLGLAPNSKYISHLQEAERRSKNLSRINKELQARLDAVAKVQRYVVDSTVPLQITTDSEGDFMLADDVLAALEQK